MPKIRLHHVRALLCTYLVWAILNLSFASAVHNAIGHTSASIPYIWALLHILPLWALWDSGTDGFGALAVVVIAGSSMGAGLLKNRRWACVLAILGMSLWFLAAWVLAGISV
jgi:hypothetical protein